MWRYEQTTGNLYTPEGVHFSTGYAGAVGYKNNPRFQDIKYKGPLPCGLYFMAEIVEHTRLGPDAIRLEPGPENEMFGRSGFFIHGDDVINPGHGSDGCICAPRFARVRMWESPDHLIEVVASFPGVTQA